jgi:hypothetical protein
LLYRFTDLTGTDYSQGAVELAGAVAERSNVDNITFLVDDILDSKLNRQFQLVTDKGTLDAIGLHPDGVAHRFQYWKALCKLVAPGGVLVWPLFLTVPRFLKISDFRITLPQISFPRPCGHVRWI